MLEIKTFTFNAFQENTYLLYNNDKDAIVFDPGCSNINEQKSFSDFITSNNLKLRRLINTHCHIDHVSGNQFVADTYKLELEASQIEIPILESCTAVSKMYGIPYNGSPAITKFIKEGDIIELGESSLEVLLCPGHSPGSLCFYNRESKLVIGGDVLFFGSIGRTDLPGGDHNTLLNSIREKIFTLPDDTLVYPGHGQPTYVGYEKKTNPFLS